MKLRTLCIVINGLIFSTGSYATDYTTSQTLSNNHTDTTINISNGALIDIAGNGHVDINNTDVSGSGVADTILINNGSINLGSGSRIGADITATTPNDGINFYNRTVGIYVRSDSGTQATNTVTAEELTIAMDASNNTDRTAAVYGIYTDRNNNSSTIEYNLTGETRIEINNVNSFTGSSGQLNGIGLTNSANGIIDFSAEHLTITIDDNHDSGNYVGMKFKNNTSAPTSSLHAEYNMAMIEINADNQIVNGLGVFVRNAEIENTAGTQITFNSKGDIATTTNSSLSDDVGVHGIKVNNTGSFAGSNIRVDFLADGNIGAGTTDTIVNGVNVNNDSKLTSNDLNVSFNAQQAISSAIGVNVDSGSELDNTGLINITMNAASELVAKAINVDAGSLTTQDTIIQITSDTSNSNGFSQGVKGIAIDNTGKVELKGTTEITLTQQTNNSSMVGVDIAGTDSTLIGKTYMSIMLDSQTNTEEVVGINVSATSSSSAIKNLDLDLDVLAISSSGTDATGAYIRTTDGISDIKTGSLEFSSPAGNDVLAIDASGGKLTINVTDNSYVTGDMNVTNAGTEVDFTSSGSNGNTYIESDITASNGGKITLDLQNGQLISTTSNSSGAGNIGLTLSNNMTWDMTASSQVTDLDLSDSTINFVPTIDSTLITNSLQSTNGGGSFKMHVDMGAQTGDKIIIGDSSSPLTQGSSDGAYSLILTNNGSAATTGNERYDVVEDYSPTADANATFTSNTVEQGGFQYGLRTTVNSQGAKVHQLYALNRKSSSADAAISFLKTNYLLSYIDLQTLFQRMGELRSNQGQEGNFWIRSYAGKLNSFSTNHGLRGFHMNYSGLQLGIDKLITGNNGDTYVGLMAGYSDADPRYRNGGSGGVRGVNFGMYGTYIANNGFYVDAVAKYHRMKNNFSVKDSLGDSVKGKSKSDGYSLSLEAGKRFNIEQTAFYLEPQAQVVYSHQQGDKVNASNGLRVKLGSYDSLIGSTRLVIGYNLVKGDSPIDLQMKSGYVREFKGNTSYHLNTYKEDYKFRGGWVETSVGVSAQLNKQHNIYGEVSYANGSRFDKRQINLGYRFQF